MGLGDLMTRVDLICKKYDKYDMDKHRDPQKLQVGGDAFTRLYDVVQTDLDSLIQKSEAVATQINRATIIAMNAEIRRIKARLLEEIPKLQRLAYKKVKEVSKEELEARNELVSTIKERIEEIPDGSNLNATKPTGGSTFYTAIKFDSTSDGRFDSERFQQTDETARFRQEYEIRKMKQDENLDVITEGLHTLKNMAHDMNEELDRQLPLMSEIDDKVDKANTDLKSTNVRLKETVIQLRSSRNFCCDVILLVIVLGIAVYLYNVLK